MTKLEELKAAYAATTHGEWTAPVNGHSSDCTIYTRSPVYGNPIYLARVYGDGGITRFNEASADKQANATFIALSHNLMPTLLEAVGLLRLAAETIEGEYPESDDRYEIAVRANKLLEKLNG